MDNVYKLTNKCCRSSVYNMNVYNLQVNDNKINISWKL